MIGTTISHYNILEKLGEGGMGVVYKAEDTRLHRHVALKIPSKTVLADEDMQSRFLNEARMAAAFLHQNIAVLHDIGEHEGKPFLVMEYVEGDTLRALTRSGPVSIDRLLHLAIQICSALDAVHEKNVMHRDIKTDNILLTKKDQIKLADCGLAARFVAREGLAERLGQDGTLPYMSPEQIRGEKLDQRSDIFSLGVVLYELLTGALPFEARPLAALQYLIIHADPAPLQNFRNDVPPQLVQVVSRALEKDRDKRYQHAKDILHDLQKIVFDREGKSE